MQHNHTSKAIKLRLFFGVKHSSTGDFLLGAMHGLVTTFALVAEIVGTGLKYKIPVVLDFANLASDSFSIAAGNYFKAKADLVLVQKARKREEEEIEIVLKGEKEEIRQIYEKKDFEEEILESIVKTITSDKKR